MKMKSRLVDTVQRCVRKTCAVVGLALLATPGAAQQVPEPPLPAARETSRIGDVAREAPGPMTWAEPLGYTVYDQVRDDPDDWDSDADGRGRRLAANAGFAPLAWHQPDYTATTAARGIATGFVSSALLNGVKAPVFRK